mmetsp:Transcript_13368/g.21911  ORF Transcript_13368/g.21911 Transcript_13368/m.21911 type:complete len:286 (+) Transcript_13368:1-858(+)
MAYVLEVRAGSPVPVDVMLKKVPQWEVKDYASGYCKDVVTGQVEVNFKGIKGNMAGFEGHIRDILDRAVLVFYEPIYDQLCERFPKAKETLKRGGFGENLIVDHPSLSPEVVCIGDVFHIGTVKFVVTAPRQPCPKVDVYHKVKGMTEYAKQHSKSGYFFRVLEEGVLDTGSEIHLLERPNPDLSLRRVSEGLWGPPELLDNSREFLTKLANTDVLMGHLFRNTARERLRRLDEEEAAAAAVVAETRQLDEAALREEDEALASYNFKVITIFMTLFTLFLLYYYQ